MTVKCSVLNWTSTPSLLSNINMEKKQEKEYKSLMIACTETAQNSLSTRLSKWLLMDSEEGELLLLVSSRSTML